MVTQQAKSDGDEEGSHIGINFKQRAFWVLEEDGPMPPDLIGRGLDDVDPLLL